MNINRISWYISEILENLNNTKILYPLLYILILRTLYMVSYVYALNLFKIPVKHDMWKFGDMVKEYIRKECIHNIGCSPLLTYYISI